LGASELVICQVSPSGLGFPRQLLPLAFYRVFIHDRTPGKNNGRARTLLPCSRETRAPGATLRPGVPGFRPAHAQSVRTDSTASAVPTRQRRFSGMKTLQITARAYALQCAALLVIWQQIRRESA